MYYEDDEKEMNGCIHDSADFTVVFSCGNGIDDDESEEVSTFFSKLEGVKIEVAIQLLNVSRFG